MRLAVTPVAISAIVLIEQGATTMPSLRNDPLEQARRDVGVGVHDVGERLHVGDLEARSPPRAWSARRAK